MSMRGAIGPNGQMAQAFPLGGGVTKLVLNSTTWTEFVPAGSSADAYLIDIEPAPDGRFVTTDTVTFPDMTNETLVDAETVDLSIRVIAGQRPYCFDRDMGVDGQTPSVRFFFAIADATVPTSAPLRFLRAAS